MSHKADDVVAGYRIVRQLGIGGTSSVYLTLHTESHRPTALKVFDPSFRADENERRRFERHAKMMIGLSHPNLAEVYQLLAFDDDGLGAAMEFIDGDNLFDISKGRGPLPLLRVAEVVSSVASGLGHLHKNGIIHRDVKPENILIESAGEKRVVLVDFGSARKLGIDDVRITAPGASAPRTIPYASPEQLEDADLDAASDVFSLGVIAFELITGELPYLPHNSATHLLAMRMRSEPLKLAGKMAADNIPAGLQGVLDRALAAGIADRFTSAEVFASQLYEVAARAERTGGRA